MAFCSFVRAALSVLSAFFWVFSPFLKAGKWFTKTLKFFLSTSKTTFKMFLVFTFGTLKISLLLGWIFETIPRPTGEFFSFVKIINL